MNRLYSILSAADPDFMEEEHQRCRVLDLPAEIRFTIYHLVLNGEGCVHLEDTRNPLRPRVTTLSPHDGNLLLTCRRVYSEAMPVFYSAGCLTITQDDRYPSRIRRILRENVEKVAFTDETCLSTYLPGLFPNLRHVFLPEFFTEADFEDDNHDGVFDMDGVETIHLDAVKENSFLIHDLEKLEAAAAMHLDLCGLKIHIRSLLVHHSDSDIWSARHFVFTVGGGVEQLEDLKVEYENASRTFHFRQNHFGEPDDRIFVEARKAMSLPEDRWWVSCFEE